MDIEKIPEEQWEDCPYCDNTGTIIKYRTMVQPMKNANGETKPVETPEPESNFQRCHWCHMNPKSVFNQKKLVEDTERNGE